VQSFCLILENVQQWRADCIAIELVSYVRHIWWFWSVGTFDQIRYLCVWWIYHVHHKLGKYPMHFANCAVHLMK